MHYEADLTLFARLQFGPFILRNRKSCHNIALSDPFGKFLTVKFVRKTKQNAVVNNINDSIQVDFPLCVAPLFWNTSRAPSATYDML